MNPNPLPRSVASRAVLGSALVFALAMVVAPAQAQTLAISQSISLSGSGTHVVNGNIRVNADDPVLDTENSPNFGTPVVFGTYTGDNDPLNPDALIAPGIFDFSNAVNTPGGLPTTIGVVSVSLSLFGLDTTSSSFDFNDIALVLQGTVTSPSSQLGGALNSTELLNTGVLLNGFGNTLTNGSFSFVVGSAQGDQILALLNDTGGLISAGLLDLGNTGYVDNPFSFVGGNMTLGFAVPFTPMQWLGMGLIMLMAGLRLYQTGGLKQLRVMAGV